MIEEPFGITYMDEFLEDTIKPKRSPLPSIEKERSNQINWSAIQKSWSCVIGNIWLARRKNMAVCFDSDHFGCPSGAFHLGFFKPMLESTIQFVSTGSEERRGEVYLSSPDVAKMYFDTLDPQPTERICSF